MLSRYQAAWLACILLACGLLSSSWLLCGQVYHATSSSVDPEMPCQSADKLSRELTHRRDTPLPMGQFRGRGRNFRPFPSRSEFPTWTNPENFEKDVFTFARIRYTPHYHRGWDADYPDADWNLSWRLQQLTSLRVNPESVVIELTDPKLQDYPFLFLSAPYSVRFTDDEIVALRRHLLNGGFMMVDEFWGTIQWDYFCDQLTRLFPEFKPRPLSIDHEIFHMVYDFKEFPQATAIHFWQQGFSYHPVPGTETDHEPHFFGLFDKSDRMMILLCHNNDLCDGWEREGEDKEFFERFSVRNSFPMGINIITYAMTH